MGKKTILNKNFLILLIGQIVSTFGSSVVRFSIDLYVLDITKRADVFSLIVAFSFLPYLFVSPLGGIFADRFNKKTILITLEFLNAALIISLMTLLSLKENPIISIAVILMLLSVISAFYLPTVQSSVPLITDKENLEASNGIISSIGALTNILAPAVGGASYSFLGIRMLLICASFVFIVAAIIELFISIPYKKIVSGKKIISTLISDFNEGFNYVIHKNKTVLSLSISASLINLTLSSFVIVGTPIILRTVMHSNNTMYSIGMLILESGTILGAIFAGKISKHFKINQLYKGVLLTALFLLLGGLSTLSIVNHHSYMMFFVIYSFFNALIMAIATAISIIAISYIQRNTPETLLGKTMATIMALAQVAAPIGQIFYGFVLQKYIASVYISVLIATILTVAVSCFAKASLKNVKD
ncbi:MFS transporter [Lactococcus lactis]|uniref:MFS transporter n=1 Tax=Lactococcus lactis TaxID=1358 RepID=UPI002890EB6E|nr:MFS transporter [Lactococcus lactis]MDT2874293.1 MFS transporter [Lactococcus lactis]MDT2936361.1 MFS transporter [Lactococcus lactis]